MGAVKHSNFFSTTLATPPTGTTEAAFTVSSATNLPTLSAGDWTYVVLKNASLTREVIKIGTISGVTLTPASGGRGADGSAAYASWVAGDVIELCFVNASLLDLLYGFKEAFYNTAKTFKSIFSNANTAPRTYTFPDESGTVALISDAATMAASATHTTATEQPLDNADEIGFWNQATGLWAKITGTDLKATLKTYFDGLYSPLSGTPVITSSVGAGALTIGLNAISLDFRSATIGSGTVNTRATAAISLVVSSGSTLGTTSGVPARLWIAAIDNAGTLELAVMNTQLGNGQIAPVNESILITTVAEGGAGAADSAGVWYSATARSNVPFRLVGYVECTEATAGTWATAAAVIQGVGPGTRKPGDMVQTVRGINSTASTGSTVMPLDNTIPQITEGDEIVTATITPASAINILRQDYAGFMNGATNIVVTTALFQDLSNDAIALLSVRQFIQGDDPGMNVGSHAMRSATVAATTFRVRAGPHNASTTYINRTQSYATAYGGIGRCTLDVSEVMA